MRVLAIAKTFTKGGAATGARNTVLALKSAGADVMILDGFAASASGKVRFLRTVERMYERLVHGVDVHCLRLGPATFDLVQLCKEYKPQILQLFDVSGNTIAFDDINAVPVPIVQRMSDFWPYNGAHHYDEERPRRARLEDWWLRRTIYSGRSRPDLFVAPSQWLVERLQATPVMMIRNAVAPQMGASVRSLPGRPLRFGFIANPVNDPRKGVMALAPVLDAVAAMLGRIELHLFGGGSTRSIPVGTAVSLYRHPAFRKDEIESVYSRFDILLCPSRQDNSPNVLTEALSFAVPVVAQRGTGMDSYVHERFGALVDFHGGSAGEVAAEIAALVLRYGAASRAALAFSREDLAPERIGREYLAAYAALVERRQSR